jgi:hypothetical protein
VVDEVDAPGRAGTEVAVDDVEADDRTVDAVDVGADDVVVVERGTVDCVTRGVVLEGAGRRVVGVVRSGVVRGETVATTAGVGTAAGRTSRYTTRATTKTRLNTVVDFRRRRRVTASSARRSSRDRRAR